MDFSLSPSRVEDRRLFLFDVEGASRIELEKKAEDILRRTRLQTGERLIQFPPNWSVLRDLRNFDFKYGHLPASSAFWDSPRLVVGSLDFSSLPQFFLRAVEGFLSVWLTVEKAQELARLVNSIFPPSSTDLPLPTHRYFLSVVYISASWSAGPAICLLRVRDNSWEPKQFLFEERKWIERQLRRLQRIFFEDFCFFWTHRAIGEVKYGSSVLSAWHGWQESGARPEMLEPSAIIAAVSSSRVWVRFSAWRPLLSSSCSLYVPVPGQVFPVPPPRLIRREYPLSSDFSFPRITFASPAPPIPSSPPYVFCPPDPYPIYGQSNFLPAVLGISWLDVFEMFESQMDVEYPVALITDYNFSWELELREDPSIDRRLRYVCVAFVHDSPASTSRARRLVSSTGSSAFRARFGAFVGILSSVMYGFDVFYLKHWLRAGDFFEFGLDSEFPSYKEACDIQTQVLQTPFDPDRCLSSVEDLKSSHRPPLRIFVTQTSSSPAVFRFTFRGSEHQRPSGIRSEEEQIERRNKRKTNELNRALKGDLKK
ncbi:hypothetical protein BT69DRAFT_1338764 [Atractiella rhizophila]|nr:hypothetical protein BT69DRAFT_1338764 [Atractiella rhizophila]